MLIETKVVRKNLSVRVLSRLRNKEAKPEAQQ